MEQAAIYKSTDGGQTWQQPYGTVNTAEVNELTVDPEDSDRIYLAVIMDGIFIRGSSQWVQKTFADGFDADRFGSYSTYTVCIDPRNSDLIYAGRWIAFRGQANGIFRSKNKGATRQNITFNLGPEFSIWAVSVNPHNRKVYTGSSHGTWRMSGFQIFPINLLLY